MNEVEKYKSKIGTIVWIVLGALVMIAGGREYLVVGDTNYGVTLMIIGAIPVLIVLLSKLMSILKKSSSIKFPSIKNIFTAKHRKYFVGILAIVVAIFVWQAFFTSPVKILKEAGTPIATLDNLSVWKIKDGRVTVARELNIYKDGIGTKIMVANTDKTEKKNVKIYESIPKEIAKNVSELEFSHPVEIIEDDPLILWNLDLLPGTRKTLVIKKKLSEKSIADMFDNCHVDDPSLTVSEKFDKEAVVIDEIVKEFNSLDKKEVYALCLKWWRSKYQKEQEKLEEGLQKQKEEIKYVVPYDWTENKELRRLAYKNTVEAEEELNIVDKIKEKAKQIITKNKKRSQVEEYIYAAEDNPTKSTELNKKYFPSKLVTFWNYNNGRTLSESSIHCNTIRPQKSIAGEYVVSDKVKESLHSYQHTQRFVQISVYSSVKEARQAANVCGDMLFKGNHWTSLDLDYSSSNVGMPRAIVYTVDNYLIYIPTSYRGWTAVSASQKLLSEFRKNIQNQY
ncbi:MAG: hypothetical protein HQ536_01630 [Parcubacteria group bacterium]|nr:hypothetical protein [Parcubacteria group bacterium]